MAEYEPVYKCTEGCGKSFKEATLKRHIKICKKVFQSKRKKFDSFKKRKEGMDLDD